MEETPERRAHGSRRGPITLSTPQRVSTSIFGVVAAAAGSVAVFVTENQIGSTALISIGALAFLVGIVGRFPDKISKEGVEYHQLEVQAEMGRAAIDAVTSVVNDESLPRDMRDIVASTVGEEVQRTTRAGAANRATDRVQKSLKRTLFERDALAFISAHIPDGTTLFTDYAVGDPPDNWRIDAIIAPDIPEFVTLSQGVLLEIKYVESFSYTTTKILLERVASVRPGGFLYVIEFELPETVHEDFRRLAKSAGVNNAHLASGDLSSEFARKRLANAVTAVWNGAPYSNV